MPKPLKEATPRLEAGEIDVDTHARLIERRRQYMMRPKEAPRANGSQKFACPAEGAGATVDCPFKGQCAKTRGTRTKIMLNNLTSALVSCSHCHDPSPGRGSGNRRGLVPVLL